MQNEPNKKPCNYLKAKQESYYRLWHCGAKRWNYGAGVYIQFGRDASVATLSSCAATLTALDEAVE